MMARKFGAELLGTAILVFFGAGVLALVFGFRIFGASLAAGLVAVGVVFGLVYTALAYVIGPVSGAHVNPAVSLGAFLTKRMSAVEMMTYWIAQLIGALLGALVLWWVLSTSPYFSKSRIGLGANGYGGNSILHIGGGGAFLIEVVLTAVFVLVFLSIWREGIGAAVSWAGIGVGLGLVTLIGSPFDGASINPARSFGPAIVEGGSVLSQLWLFLIAPLVGAILAAGVYELLQPVPGGLRGVEQALGRTGMRPARSGQYAGNGHGADQERVAGEPAGAGNGHDAGNGHGAGERAGGGHGDSGRAPEQPGTGATPVRGDMPGDAGDAPGASGQSGRPQDTGGSRKPVWRRF
jgi:aquaporin Z